MRSFVGEAATPGRVLPSRNSREAPPPVEMWVILSATAGLMDGGDGVSAADDGGGVGVGGYSVGDGVGALAKAGISKTPMGPFQMMVWASAISLEKRAMDLGPMSRAMRSAGRAGAEKIWVVASGANLSARTWSMGRRNRTLFFAALARAALATSSLSSSTRDLPVVGPGR